MSAYCYSPFAPTAFCPLLLANLTFRIVNQTELGFFHHTAIGWNRVQRTGTTGGFLRRGRAQCAQVIGGLQSAQPRELVGLIQFAPGIYTLSLHDALPI